MSELMMKCHAELNLYHGITLYDTFNFCFLFVKVGTVGRDHV